MTIVDDHMAKGAVYAASLVLTSTYLQIYSCTNK